MKTLNRDVLAKMTATEIRLRLGLPVADLSACSVDALETTVALDCAALAAKAGR